MKKLVLRITLPLVCFVFIGSAPRIEAQSPQPTAPQAAAIFAILIGVPVGIGLGVYYAVRAPRHIQGCVADQGGGFELVDDKGRRYVLSGDTAAIQANHRLGVSGKPGKGDKKRKPFLVKKVSRDYGACQAAAPTP